MILTRKEIKTLIQKKDLCFEPGLDAFQNQPHAIDLRLGNVFYVPKIWKMTKQGRKVLMVDTTESVGNNFEKIELKMGQFFELAPGESVIASTLEKITLKAPDIMGVLYPRSSINRRGLTVDLTGIVDVHYAGHLMIPILNKTTSQIIRIYVGERVCQIVFQKLINTVSQKQGLLHGRLPAKYNGASAKNLLSKKDDNLEIEIIKKGDLKALKKFKY